MRLPFLCPAACPAAVTLAYPLARTGSQSRRNPATSRHVIADRDQNPFVILRMAYTISPPSAAAYLELPLELSLPNASPSRSARALRRSQRFRYSERNPKLVGASDCTPPQLRSTITICVSGFSPSSGTSCTANRAGKRTLRRSLRLIRLCVLVGHKGRISTGARRAHSALREAANDRPGLHAGGWASLPSVYGRFTPPIHKTVGYWSSCLASALQSQDESTIRRVRARMNVSAQRLASMLSEPRSEKGEGHAEDACERARSHKIFPVSLPAIHLHA